VLKSKILKQVKHCEIEDFDKKGKRAFFTACVRRKQKKSRSIINERKKIKGKIVTHIKNL
jgi:hypothetical protein